MIAVIDYGMGNLKSVQKALRILGAEVKIISNREKLSSADKAVLPGVGAFRDAMEGIEERGLRRAICDFIKSGKPYLGICMGFQILFEESEEGGTNKGLGIFKGRVKRFPESLGLKIPHMGWNELNFRKDWQNCPMLKSTRDKSYFYFVHSYYVEPEDKDPVVCTTDYGIKFAAMLWKDNVYAVQFHPEKSQEAGLRMLKHFVDL